MQWCKLDWNTLLRIISPNPKRKPHAGYSSPCKSGESWKVLKEMRNPGEIWRLIPPVQNQSHCMVSFLLHYFLEKSLKTPRYPGRRVCWGKDAWVLQKMSLFAVPPGIYPWARLWGVMGRVQLGVAYSHLRFLGCAAQKGGTTSPNGIISGVRDYLNNVNNVTTARSLIWVNLPFHMNCGPWRGEI